jgi:hypothetical protein
VQPDGSLDYSKITSFSAADYAFMFHYAQALPVKGLSVGGNVKMVYRQIGKFAKAYGFGIDLRIAIQTQRMASGLDGARYHRHFYWMEHHIYRCRKASVAANKQ